MHIRVNVIYLTEFVGRNNMSPDRDITTVGIPKSLRERYHKLKHSKDYHSFAEFCRNAVLEKIKAEED